MLDQSQDVSCEHYNLAPKEPSCHEEGEYRQLISWQAASPHNRQQGGDYMSGSTNRPHSSEVHGPYGPCTGPPKC